MTREPTETLSDDMQRKIKQLFARQGLAVLATKDEDGHPYASLIAFAANENISELYFITPTTTRKNANLMDDDRVALLVNDGVNQPDDFHEAMAVTVLGQARAVGDDERSAYLPVYLKKHPYLFQFAHSPSCALYVVEITGFTMVQQFQNVSELRLDHDLGAGT